MLINYVGNHLAHRTMADIKAMGQIFSMAALSLFLIQFTIHGREQIRSCIVTAQLQTPENSH